MRKHLFISIIFLFFVASGFAQEKSKRLEYKGNLIMSGYQALKDVSPKTMFSANYFPQLNYQLDLGNSANLSFEVSADILGRVTMDNANRWTKEGEISPYRVWTSFAKDNFELRAGLQQINFGSAQLFRPLQWFDGLDPLDPTKQTKGVWGILTRYYLKNNANLWIWGLTGNKDKKGMELFGNKKRFSPEFGGRLQYPVAKIGEIALSYNYRNSLNIPITEDRIDENRFGLDAKFDYVVGSWVEMSVNKYNRNIATPLGVLPQWQKMITIGCDYSIPISDKLLYIMGEHFITSSSEKLRGNDKTYNISGAMLSCQLNSLINISLINSYSWDFKCFSANAMVDAKWDNLQVALRGGVLTNSDNIPVQLSTKMPPSNILLTVSWTH